MSFKKDLKRLNEIMQDGDMLKLPHWSGFWRKEFGMINMYTKDNKVINILDAEDKLYTETNLGRMIYENEVATRDNCPAFVTYMEDKSKFTFNIKLAKRLLKLGIEIQVSGIDSEDGVFKNIKYFDNNHVTLNDHLSECPLSILPLDLLEEHKAIFRFKPE